MADRKKVDYLGMIEEREDMFLKLKKQEHADAVVKVGALNSVAAQHVVLHVAHEIQCIRMVMESILEVLDEKK